MIGTAKAIGAVGRLFSKQISKNDQVVEKRVQSGECAGRDEKGVFAFKSDK